MEYWDIYDKYRVKTGKTLLRGQPLTADEYHQVIHICIFAPDGKMLIQQRQPFKDGWPNLWDITVGGSSVAGETSRETAQRELFEEIGLKHDFGNETPLFSINALHCFDDYYLLEREVDISALKLQPEEVQRVRWASKDEILKMIDSDVFIPYKKGLIEMIFEMRLCRGAHTV